MNKRKTLSLALTGLGLALAVGGPFLPGGVHLTPNDPPRTGHVTSLVATSGGDILAGTQAGEVWRLHGGLWTREALSLGGEPVLAMLDKPGRTPVGTPSGLRELSAGTPSLDGRVGSLLELGKRLVAGTATGVRLLSNGQWLAPGPEANVYSLASQTKGEQTWVHAGTIGAGVLSAPASRSEAPWDQNSEGLPIDAKVFSFAVTRDGRLLAGTDQGLFWQTEPGQPWTSLHAQLIGRRILSLYLAPTQGTADAQILWIGSDEGLLSMRIEEETAGIAAKSPPTPADDAEHQPPFGISWIVPDGDRVMISAGAVYRYGPTQLDGWYWISSIGLILILAAGWLMPQPGRELPGSSSSPKRVSTS